MDNNKIFAEAMVIATNILERAAQCVAYPKTSEVSGWSDKFCREELGRAFKGFGYYEVTEPYHNQAFWDAVMTLPNDLRELLGFRKYSSRCDPKMLVPLWIVMALPDEVKIKATRIDGNEVVLDNAIIDKDTRGGCVAYLV